MEYEWKPAQELLDKLLELKTSEEDSICYEFYGGDYMKFKFYTDDRTKYVEINNSEEPLEGEMIITSVCYKLVDNKLVVESFDDFVCEPEFLDKMSYVTLNNNDIEKDL